MNVYNNRALDVLIMISLFAVGLLLLSQLNGLNFSDIYKEHIQHTPMYTDMPLVHKSVTLEQGYPNTIGGAKVSNTSGINMSGNAQTNVTTNGTTNGSYGLCPINSTDACGVANTTFSRNATDSLNLTNETVSKENTSIIVAVTPLSPANQSPAPTLIPIPIPTLTPTSNQKDTNQTVLPGKPVEKKTNIRAIVYLLPRSVCSPKWTKKYGDRIFFYVYEDLNGYKSYINTDFNNIKKVYNTVIIVLPADDTDRYFNNLNIINNLAEKNDMKVIYAIFPNEKYGSEERYLFDGTKMHTLVLDDMKSMKRLSQTYKVAVWYGWTYRAKGSDILNFYNTLPDSLEDTYALWLDEEYIKKVSSIADRLPRSLLVITEWYQPRNLCSISIFKNQMIVTGYSDAKTGGEWLNGVRLVMNKERNKCGKSLNFGIWDYYDKNDGAGEDLSAYFPKESQHLKNPWN